MDWFFLITHHLLLITVLYCSRIKLWPPIRFRPVAGPGIIATDAADRGSAAAVTCAGEPPRPTEFRERYRRTLKMPRRQRSRRSCNRTRTRLKVSRGCRLTLCRSILKRTDS